MPQQSLARQRGFDAFAPPQSTLYLRPLGFVRGAAASAAVGCGLAYSLAGGPHAFTLIEASARDAQGATLSAVGTVAELIGWSSKLPSLATQVRSILDRLTQPRPRFAGLALDRPLLMGILNVTPDSFSDGGDFLDSAHAIAHGRALLAAGADILDIGGESTRPGAGPVAPEEETERVLPVIRALAEAGAVISVDTRHASVMEAALHAGALIVNDVTALTGDHASLGVVTRAGAAVILMHMQGDPRSMQAAPNYQNVAPDIFDFLQNRIAACVRGGIPAGSLMADPGIGFGKTGEHNFALLARLGLLHGLGTGIVLGASRKSFIAKASRGEAVNERLPGSLAAALSAAEQGVQMLRVHDVAETKQALAVLARMGAAS